MLPCVFLAFFALATFPHPGAFHPAPPRLSIEPRGRVDLGELGPLECRSQRYWFTNVSPGPIVLRLLDLSPGVTVEGPALEGPLEPKASAELRLRVDPAGWVGTQLRNVRLETDDPGQGRYYLPIAFRVRPDLTVDGERCDLGEVEVPQSPRVIFTFSRESGLPLLLQLTGERSPHLDVDLEGGRGKGSAVLGVTLRSLQVAPGVCRGFEHLPVETNAPGQPHFDLYVSWELRRPIEAEPSRALFMGGLPQVPLTLKTRRGKPFRIRALRVEGLGFRVDPLEGVWNPEQILVLRCHAAAPAKGMLVLDFEGEEEPLKVPLAHLP